MMRQRWRILAFTDFGFHVEPEQRCHVVRCFLRGADCVELTDGGRVLAVLFADGSWQRMD